MDGRSWWSFAIQVTCGLILGNLIAFNGPLAPYSKDMAICENRTEEYCALSSKYSTCVWAAAPPLSPVTDAPMPTTTVAPASHNDTTTMKPKLAALLHATTSAVPSDWTARCYDTCNAYVSQSECTEQSQCQYVKGKCITAGALSTTWETMFASGTLFGAPIGTIVSFFTLRRGAKPTCVVGVAFFLVGMAIMTASWQEWSKAGLLVGRIIIGAAMGILGNGAPNYNVTIVRDVDLRMRIGACFQISLTFGIFLTAAVGIAFQPKEHLNEWDMIKTYQSFILLGWIIGGLATVATLLCPSAESADEGDVEERPINKSGDIEGGQQQLRVLSFVMAAVLCLVQQFTGINAIMNYSGAMCQSVGIENQYIGNCLVMLWNFLTTLVSIPMSKCGIAPRKAFMACAIFASTCCIITGIPVYPGVTQNDGARTAVATIGILGFIAAFEIGMGAWFYVLAQDMFRVGRERQIGSTFTNFFQLVLNLIIVIAYPYAVKNLSDPDTDPKQHRGFAIATFFFGVVGLAGVAVLLGFMPKTEAELEREEDER